MSWQNGTVILQKLLTNMLEYYDRYLKILKTVRFAQRKFMGRGV